MSFAPSGIETLGEGDSVDKEEFYEMSADLHLVDPNSAMQYFVLEASDIEELAENVAPFLGSWMRRPQFNEQYPYYELYEGSDRVAQVFQVAPRGEAFSELHREFVEEVRSRLPPVDERPSIGYLNVFEGSVYIRDPSVPGYQTKPLRDLEVPRTDAFAGRYPEGENALESDFEGLLEADPDVVLLHAGLNSVRDDEDVLQPFRENPVASEVSAVKKTESIPGTSSSRGRSSTSSRPKSLRRASTPRSSVRRPAWNSTRRASVRPPGGRPADGANGCSTGGASRPSSMETCNDDETDGDARE